MCGAYRLGMRLGSVQWTLITAAIVAATGRLVLGEECPHVCVCYPNLAEASRTLTVDCRGQDLFEIPFPLPNTTSHLDVSNNEIQFVRFRDLQNLPQLTYLQLQNNDIMEIETGAFRELANLERLNLFNNQIRELRSGVFDGLGKLQSLVAHSIHLQSYDLGIFDDLDKIVEIDLSFNDLESLPSLSFSELPRLQRLILCDNYISEIGAMAVNRLPALLYLNLARNQIQVVPPQAFTRLPKLRTLALSGNPLECGCDAIWLFGYVKRRNLTGPTCEQPETFVGRNLLSLTKEEFCALPTANISGVYDLVVPQGETLMVECATAGAPPPEVVWSRDGMTFDPRDRRISYEGEILVVSQVREEDSGVYHCTASSTAGTVGDSVRVTVIDVDAQNFSLFTALLDSAVELTCSESLPPGVSVRWEFNGSTVVESDKYVIVSNGDLMILDLQLADEGVYTCSVDGLTFLRELAIIAAPTITEFPQGPCTNPSTLVVDSTEITTLTCAAFGVPPPSVQWIFSSTGMVQVGVLPTPGLTAGETVAVLELAQPLEEMRGEYRCRATNFVGEDEKALNILVNVILEINVSRFIEIEVRAGATVILPCDLEGVDDPGANVTWQRMIGLPLPENSYVTPANELVLPDVSRFDISVYQCLVQYSSGVVAGLEYGLLVFEPPEIFKQCPIYQRAHSVGDLVVLLCDLLSDGSPLARVVWIREGRGQVTNSSRVALVQSNMQLEIDPVQEEDSGVYTCRAGNEYGNDSFSIQLDVHRRPFFRHEPHDVNVVAGSTTMLQCSGSGRPQPELTWWRVSNGGDAELVIPDSRVIVSDEFLVFLEVQESDEGAYYCNLTSPLEQISSSTVDLTVWTPPTITSAIAPTYIVLEGRMNLLISCAGTGDPPPAIHWLKDDIVLGFRDPGAQLDLWFVEVRMEDAGVYTCRMANVAGQVTREVEIVVRAPPDTQVHPLLAEANVGSQVTLFCSDGGRVPEEFEWQYEGEMLTSGGNVFVRPTGELVISNVQVSDSGVYTCEVWGIAGPASNSSILVVTDPLFSSTSGTAPPTIVSPTPSFQFVPTGQTAQFVCAFTGFPEPTIEWTKDDSPLPNLKRIDDVVPGGGLSIMGLRVTDTATYRCNVSNPLGTQIRSFDLVVTEAPTFRFVPSPLTITRPSPILMNCSARGTPPPVILWRFNEAPLPVERRILVDWGGLRIYNTTVNDTGLYTCIAINSAGVIEYTVPVTVNTLLIPPNITIPPQSVTVMAWDAVLLDCIAEGYPFPQITWLRDGEPLNTTCRHGGEAECVRVDGPSVFIQRSEEWDTGRYTCIAENAAGRTVYEAFVTVLPLEVIPFFVVYPRSVWVEEGGTVSIDCQAVGMPRPNITWLRGFDEFNNTDQLHVLDNGTLVITDAQLNDSAMYVCRASNEAGVNQIIITVDVLANFTNGTRPRLVTFPIAEITVDPEESVTIDCVAEGNPTPYTQWLMEGLPVDFDAQPNAYRAPNGSLVITNVTELDAGLYSCLAVNRLGTTEAFVRISVALGTAQGLVELVDDTKPHITVLPSETEALVGSEVTVSCQTRGAKDPYVMWTHDDKPVYESEMVTVAPNGSLIIHKAHPAHAGTYTCLAANRVSIAEKDVILAVSPRKEPPYFTREPQSMRVLVGTHFILHCEAVDAMGPVVTWWVEGGHELTVDVGRMELLSDGSLLVTRVKPSDSKVYTCQADGNHGVSTVTAHITVLGLPLNGTVRAEVGDSTRVVCEGGGGGTPVVWKRNGDSLSSDRRIISFKDDIWIFGVTTSDEGEYTCYRGNSVLNYYLEVTVSPVITFSSTVVQAVAGSTAALHCTVTGKPRPLVAWQHSGGEVERDSQHSVLSNGTLVVYGVRAGRNEGQYVCQGSNVAGVARVTVLLVITGT